MKKILLLSILITSLSYSQSDKSKISFGISLGSNISFFNTPVSELGNKESLGYSKFFRFSAQLDLSTFYRVNEYIRLESGLRYIGKGTEYRKKNSNVIIISSNGADNGYYKTRFRLDYIEIPLKANFNLKKIFKSPNFEQQPIYLNLGLSGGINIKSDIRSNSYAPSSSSGGGVFVDVKESFDTTEFDFAEPFIINSIFGVKYIMQESKDYKFSVNLEYNQSLQDVYKENLIQSQYNFKTKNSSISLSFGIEFK